MRRRALTNQLLIYNFVTPHQTCLKLRANIPVYGSTRSSASNMSSALPWGMDRFQGTILSVQLLLPLVDCRGAFVEHSVVVVVLGYDLK